MTQICGLRPSGELHLGHYFAVIEPALAGANVLIARYHAPECLLTSGPESKIQKVISTLRRFGISNYFLQELDIEAYFLLLNIARPGELDRMTQYRAAGGKTAHLFVYPVLMAHDVMGYDEVVVGEDQTQHLNYARTLIRRYNSLYGKIVTVPEAKLSAGRIMSLTHSARKMSKSDPKGCVFLDDPEDVIVQKVRKAITTPGGEKNLKELYQRLGGTEVFDSNSRLKENLAGLIISKLSS